MNSALDLLSTLDKLANSSKPLEVDPLNQSALIWFRIRRMYEDEKRKKKLKDIENKPQMFVLERKPSERRSQYRVPYQKSLISPQIHNSVLHAEDVFSLIKVLLLVSNVCDVDMLRDCIFSKISQLKVPEDVLRAFTKVIYCPTLLKRGRAAYELLERQMIDIILNISMAECPPEKVLVFVRSLPFIGESTLKLLSYFLQEVSHPATIDSLYEFFMKLFPSNPSDEQIRYLIRISSHKALEDVYNLFQQNLVDFRTLEDEAKQKLKRIPAEFNERGKAMLSFVFFVAAHGGEIWTDIIEWETTAPNEYKTYLKERAQKIVEDQQIQIDYLRIILLKLTNIDHESEIADIFFNNVIALQDKDKLNNPVVRKFLASKLLYKLNLLKQKQLDFNSSSLAVIFNCNLNYTEILLELLDNDAKSKEFYSYFLESEECDKPFLQFLDALLLKKKAKLKTFFVKLLNNGGGLLTCGQNKLIKYFMEKLPLELCYASIKEVSSKSPAPYYVMFLIHWLKKFKGHPNYSFLRKSIVRNLNIVLLRSDLELSRQFLHDLNKIRKEELTTEENMQLTADLPRVRRELIESAQPI